MNEQLEQNQTLYLKRFNAALDLREIPDYPAALAQLQQAAELAPTDSAVLMLLGVTYQNLGRYAEAESVLRSVLKTDPAHTEALQSLVMMFLEQKKYKQAVEFLMPVAETDEYNLLVQQAMADYKAEEIRKITEEAQQAIADYEAEEIRKITEEAQQAIADYEAEEARKIAEADKIQPAGATGVATEPL